MSDVEFEQDNFSVPQRVVGRQTSYSPFGNNGGDTPSGFIGLIMKTGIVKDVQQANYVLIGIAIIFFMVSIYFFFFSGPKKPVIKPVLPTNNIGCNISASMYS